jgi:hypothetical protein
MEYRQEDPFAVNFVANPYHPAKRITWTFARALLAEVLEPPILPDPTGYVIGRAGLDAADVHFRAYSDETIDMYLSSPDGLCTVQFQRSAIALFLHATEPEWLGAIQDPTSIATELDEWLAGIHD